MPVSSTPARRPARRPDHPARRRPRGRAGRGRATRPPWSRRSAPPTSAASRCCSSGGGSNLVVADEGFPGRVVVVRNRGRAVEARPLRRGVRRVRRGGDLGRRGRHRRRAGLDRHRGALRHPRDRRCDADPERRRLRPGGRPDARPRAHLGPAVDGQVRTFAAADCGFGYRTSRFKQDPGRYVVLAVTFQLTLGDLGAPVQYAELADALDVAIGERAPSADVREAVLALRRRKGMVLDPDDHDTWSTGSFFTNPVVPADEVPAGAPAWPQSGRARQDERRLADRARGLRQGLRQRPGAALLAAHPGADQPRGRHHRRRAGAGPRDPRRGRRAVRASPW